MIYRCPLCFEVTRKKVDIIEHFSKKHDLKLETESLVFPSMDKCLKWKEDMEKSTFSKFVKKRGSLKDKHYTQHFYQCHRSGNYVFRGKGMRKLKTIGSNKINGVCPAEFNIFEKQNGKCDVVFHKTHIGHDKDLNRLNLSSVERQFILDRLAKNVPLQTILIEARRYAEENDLKRLSLLTNKELHNMKYCYMKELDGNPCSEHRNNYPKTQSFERSLVHSSSPLTNPKNGAFETQIHSQIVETNDDFVRKNLGCNVSGDKMDVALLTIQREMILGKIIKLINKPNLMLPHLKKIESFIDNFEINNDL